MPLLKAFKKCCCKKKGKLSHHKVYPLPEACQYGDRVKVCKIKSDRKTCAKMANIGLLPGTELEILCNHKGRQCMVKVNGGTVSLDSLTAAEILVAPV